MNGKYRVTLRPFRSEDLSGMRSWVNDPDTTRFLGGSYSGPETWEMTEMRLNRILNGDAGGVQFVIADAASGHYLGQCDLMMVDRLAGKAEVAMVLCPDARGQGFAKEAMLLLAEHAFRRMNLRRLYLYVAADNVPAVKCYEACGFAREGVLRQHMYADGKYRDVLVMGLLREEKGE